jgi:prepilin-type N-terminal cleavage/methylation domain-containing protein
MTPTPLPPLCDERPVRRRRARRGFALIEMMLTIMMLSVGLLALSSYSATMSRQMREGGGMVQASSQARTRFERLRAQPCLNLTAGTTTATTGVVTETWTVTPGTRSVAVSNSVSYPVGQTRRSATFQTLIPCAARP